MIIITITHKPYILTRECWLKSIRIVNLYRFEFNPFNWKHNPNAICTPSMMTNLKNRSLSSILCNDILRHSSTKYKISYMAFACHSTQRLLSTPDNINNPKHFQRCPSLVLSLPLNAIILKRILITLTTIKGLKTLNLYGAVCITFIVISILWLYPYIYQHFHFICTHLSRMMLSQKLWKSFIESLHHTRDAIYLIILYEK